jgi:hypothetical protein
MAAHKSSKQFDELILGQAEEHRHSDFTGSTAH